MTIGQKIVDSRKKRGMTAEALGGLIGMSKGGMWKIENDALKGGPDPETVIRISRALGDPSILVHALKTNPIWKEVIPQIFPDLNNIRRDPAIVFSRFADEALEAVEAARILSQIFSNADPGVAPNFRDVFAAKMEQVIDVQRCAEILMLQLVEAGVMTDDERRELYDRQQAKCERNGHHLVIDARQTPERRAGDRRRSVGRRSTNGRHAPKSEGS